MKVLLTLSNIPVVLYQLPGIPHHLLEELMTPSELPDVLYLLYNNFFSSWRSCR